MARPALSSASSPLTWLTLLALLPLLVAKDRKDSDSLASLASLFKFRPGPASPRSSAESEATATAVLDPNLLIKPPLFPEEESWPGSCRLRSKRYVSDGLCVSLRPISEVVCAVSCVMNAWIQGGSRPLPWRCTDSGWKRQRVRLLCRDGSTRFYRIRVVQSCRCVPRARAAARPAARVRTPSTPPASDGATTNQLD